MTTPTTRELWTVAWRNARRRFKPGPKDEASLLDWAQKELGGTRLSLDWQCLSGRCMWARRFETEADYFRRLRTKRCYALSDRCRDRWEREAREEAAAGILSAAAPYTPREPRKFLGA